MELSVDKTAAVGYCTGSGGPTVVEHEGEMFGGREDPLELILESSTFDDRFWMADRAKELKALLDWIEAALATENPKAREKALTEAGRRLSFRPAPSTGELTARLTAAHRKLVDLNPRGRIPAEKGILMSLATGADESLVPFFAGLFGICIDRDQLSATRKHFAAAGLGILVRSKGLRPALDALLNAATSIPDGAEAAVRALELVFAKDPYEELGSRRKGKSVRRAPPAEVMLCLTRVAREHPAFLGRYYARKALLSLGGDVPVDHPDGAFVFKMTIAGYSGFSARLLVPSSSELDSLLWLSLGCLDWDSDHLHSFHLSGKVHDHTAEYPARDDDGRATGPAMTVGQLGLVPKAKFVCLYDFGDHNVFNYTCEEIIHTVPGSPRSRVLAKKGSCPDQYPVWD